MQAVMHMFMNWKTAVPGTLALLCGSADLLGMIPDPYGKVAIHFCLFLVAIGVIAAKDADKSNAPAPTAVAQKLAVAVGAVLLIGVAGCGTAFQFPKDLKDPAKVHAVLVKLKADAQTVAVIGCANLPTAELVLDAALQLLPPGTTIDQIHEGLAIAQPQIEAFCLKLKQQVTPAAPVVGLSS